MTIRPHLDAERPLHAPLQVFDLNDIAVQVWAEAPGAGDHSAITLRKGPNLRLVLLTMHAGSRLDEHEAFAPIALHVISGHIRVTAEGAAMDLGPDMVVTLDGGIAHSVDAVADSVCLLTLAGASTPT
jgi:quercetin dioxygenase-like cupin family protein